MSLQARRVGITRALVLFALLSSTSASGLERGSPSGLELRVLKVKPPHAVTIQLKNSTADPLRLFDESNSWGAARWRILRVRQGAAALAYQIPIYAFTRNLPSYQELRGQGAWEKELDLSDDTWRTHGMPDVTLETGDLLVVIYDVPVSSEARRLGVWHGAVSASASVAADSNAVPSGSPR